MSHSYPNKMNLNWNGGWEIHNRDYEETGALEKPPGVTYLREDYVLELLSKVEKEIIIHLNLQKQNTRETLLEDM